MLDITKLWKNNVLRSCNTLTSLRLLLQSLQGKMNQINASEWNHHLFSIRMNVCSIFLNNYSSLLFYDLVSRIESYTCWKFIVGEFWKHQQQKNFIHMEIYLQMTSNRINHVWKWIKYISSEMRRWAKVFVPHKSHCHSRIHLDSYSVPFAN